MAEKNHVTVMIEGRTMTIVGTESPEYMKSVVDYIEQKQHREEIESELENIKNELEKTKEELENANKEIEQLNRDIYILKDDMNMLAEEKAQVEDQLDEYFVALDASKNISHKNRNNK